MRLAIERSSRPRALLGAAAIASALVAAPALASSHREAPAISQDPTADNTDLYAWVTPGTHDKLNIVANYIPLEEPSGGPNFHSFSDEVLYEIHVTRGGTDLHDVATYQIRFHTTLGPDVDEADQSAPPGGGKEFFIQLSGNQQTYDVVKVVQGIATTLATNVPVAPANIGPRSQGFAQGAGAAYDDAFAATFIRPMMGRQSEGRVWAGPRDDGFYVDLGGVFDLANLRPNGVAQDGVAGYNVHSIVLEIPTAVLMPNGRIPTTPSADSTLGIWASAKRRKITMRQFDGSTINMGPWVQVSRLGLPLVNEALIGIQDKDKWNAASPEHDVRFFGAYFLNPIVVRDAEAVGIYQALGVDPTPFKFNRTDIINIISLIDAEHDIQAVGDVLRVDVAKDSGFPNGRPIPGGARPDQEQADVTDVLLSVLLSKGMVAISDGVDYNDKNFLTEMPWLPLPHQGFAEGHGKPTPLTQH